MSRDEVYLRDVLDAATVALGYVGGKTREEFLADMQLQDAVIRRLSILGEAARRVSDIGRAAWPELPWAEMVGMRNIVVHEYDNVDAEVVWSAVQEDLPRLVRSLNKVLGIDNP